MLVRLGSSIISSFTKGVIVPKVTMSSSSDKLVTIDQLKNYINKKSIYLIDVREKQELAETGVLPNSVNIPVAEVETALQLSEQEFKTKYNENKPKKDEKLVFSCKAGGRSAKAMTYALKLGYENSMNYIGGWNEWAKYLDK